LLVRLESQAVAVNQLEQENSRLRSERDTFEAALSKVSRQMDTFEAQATRLASELSVEDLPTMQPSGGGSPGNVPNRFWFDNEVSGLQSRTESLHDSFVELDMAFQERRNHLAATPNVMPVEGWFSHGFGWRKDPFTGEREFHRGIDIVAPQDTSVQASADGVVARSGRSPDLGKVLEIAHGYGYVTRYAHLNQLLVQRGDRVKRGDLVGRVGSTGRSTGPHLHYEVFRDGRRVNPWKYLGQPGR
jgi:murein DD-endopeptidase MepM/ murein hydrolase activator NlpD